MTYLPKNKLQQRKCARCKVTYTAKAASAKYCDACRPLAEKERLAARRVRQKQAAVRR